MLFERLRARPETRSGRVQVPYRADRRPDFRCATGTLSPPRDPFDITRPAPSEFPDGLLWCSINSLLGRGSPRAWVGRLAAVARASSGQIATAPDGFPPRRGRD